MYVALASKQQTASIIEEKAVLFPISETFDREVFVPLTKPNRESKSTFISCF
jgi:hypothetical protein